MAPETKKQKRLGKGLSALIGEVEGAGLDVSPSSGPKTASNTIKIKDIRPNPAQPRRTFDEAELAELSQSIAQNGVIQPILVRPDPDAPEVYQIIAGERRWRAAQKAGLEVIPAVVRDADELELLEVGIIENVQRSDLNPIEEAEAYGALIKRFGRTQDGLATSVGKSRAHIANTLRLLQLSETAREHLRHGRISAGHARAALGCEQSDAVIDMVLRRSLSVRDTESLAKSLREGIAIETVSGKVHAAEKDVDTAALEADLARALGLVVDIRNRAKGGELRIKYRDLEQLDDLCRKLTAAR